MPPLWWKRWNDCFNVKECTPATLEKLDRIDIGGLKVLEEGACVQSSSPLGDNCRLGAKVCGPLARDRINLSYLTYIAGDRQVLCTAGNAGGAALSLLQSHAEPASALVLQPATAILARPK